MKKKPYPQITSQRSNELELLLACARPQPGLAQLEKIRELVCRVNDWFLVLDLAQRHSLVSLLCRYLESADLPFLPKDVRSRFQDLWVATVADGLVKTGELLRLTRFFEDAGIEVLALKGPALAQLVFGDPALRRYQDLDLLVKPEAAFRAGNLLEQQGYRPLYHLDERQKNFLLKHDYEFQYVHTETGLAVDLQWGLLAPKFTFSPPPGLAWQGSEEVDLGWGKVKTLSPENLLLFLCAHGAKHNWASLHWLCDVAGLLEGEPDLDWNLILARTGRLGSERMLGLGLYLVNSLFGTSLPASIVERLGADPRLPALAAQVEEQLYGFSGQPALKRNSVRYLSLITARLGRDQIFLESMNQWRDRLTYWLNDLTVPTPKEWEQWSVPARLFPLYRLLRPLRLFLRYRKAARPL